MLNQEIENNKKSIDNKTEGIKQIEIDNQDLIKKIIWLKLDDVKDKLGRLISQFG